jgi:DNA-binding MarR family transcriptional regulator
MDETDVVGLLARACERLVGSLFTTLDDAGFGTVSTTSALAVRMLADGPMTPGALAVALGVTAQAAGKVSGELEKQGLALRGTDPRDARARPLTLTAEGRRMAETMREAESTAIEGWRAIADPDDLEALVRALRAYLESTDRPRVSQARRIRLT